MPSSPNMQIIFLCPHVEETRLFKLGITSFKTYVEGWHVAGKH
jgi:hypothetical protein